MTAATFAVGWSIDAAVGGWKGFRQGPDMIKSFKRGLQSPEGNRGGNVSLFNQGHHFQIKVHLSPLYSRPILEASLTSQILFEKNGGKLADETKPGLSTISFTN